MAKRIASPKQTSGEGFSFEDKVVAYYLIHLLNGEHPFGNKYGRIDEITFQTRPLEYLLDDLLIVTKTSTQTYYSEFSIKSYKQITSKGFPKEFISTCWEELNKKNLLNTINSNYFFGLISTPISTEVKKQLDDLLRWSKEQKSESLQKRIRSASLIKKDIYISCKCPPILQRSLKIEVSEPSILVKHLLHLEFDFLSNMSNSENEAIRLCRLALSNNNLKDANKLWNLFISLASLYRTTGANVNREKIVIDLNSQFKLKEFPEYSTDYIKLKEFTHLEISKINDAFSGEYHIERPKELSGLTEKIQNSQILILMGRSGSGKSALLKNWVEKHIGESIIFWINAKIFENKEFAEFENLLRLNYSLKEIINSVSNQSYLVIDGIDSLIKNDSLNNIISLLKLTKSSNNFLWKIILSCQSEDFNKIYEQIKINDLSIEINSYELIESDSEKIISEVLKKYSALFYLNNNKKLKQLLLNLKILDVLISKSKFLSEEKVSKWVGESDIIQWYWQVFVEYGDNAFLRSNILKKLSIKQGDLLISGIPLSNFDGIELIELRSIQQDKICIISEERIYFYHDLIGDWARTKVIIGEKDNIQEYLSERCTSPLWIKAFRYYGVFVLEQKTVIEWHRLLEEFEKQNLKILSDSLLESVLFSKNSFLNLEEIHSYLLANGGDLLTRLLNKFLFACTFPNPIYYPINNDDVTNKTIFSTIERIPNVDYWIPVLFYLHNHVNEVIGLLPGLISEISLKWLKYTPHNYYLRKEVAEMAVKRAENEYANHNSRGYYLDKAGYTKMAYNAAMFAYNEYPERTKLFALTACSRIEATSPIIEEINKINNEVEKLLKKSTSHPRKEFFGYSLSEFVGEIPAPWSIGPQKSVDNDFREICLNESGLHTIIENYPELAKEIILALLINEPKPKNRFGHRDPFNNLEIFSEHKWISPLYFRGPFFYFLRKNPVAAIDSIIQLVNFATERWKENNDEQSNIVSILLNYNNKSIPLWGNNVVYFWYRDVGNAPSYVVSALMALEKYLYDLIDEKKDIGQYISQILESSISISFCGLLISVGIKKPELFLQQLKQLFIIPEFHYWELNSNLMNFHLIGWELESIIYKKMASDWYNLPHRSWNLCTISEYLIVNYKDFEEIFLEVSNDWEKLLQQFSEKSSFRVFLENRIEFYNKKNYRISSGTDGKKYWVYKEPKQLSIRNKDRRKIQEHYNLITQFPMICRQILDGDKSINETDYEKVLDILKKIDTIKIKEDYYTNKATALSGGIAVLLIKFGNLVEKTPKIEKWCINKITEIALNPPNYDERYSPVDIYNMRWDSFCAEILPLIWVKNNNSTEIRKCICLIATSPYYKTIEILFSSAATRKESLGLNWNKLQNFILMYSAIIANDNWYEEDKKVLSELNVALCKEFMEDKISSHYFPLKSIYQNLPKIIYNKLKSLNKRFGEIDLLLVKAAFNWLFSKDNFNESNKILALENIGKDFFNYTLEKIKMKNPLRGNDHGFPDEWDKWVFDFLPLMIINNLNQRESETFWKPLLELGIPFHYYIEDFFRGWFIYYLRNVELEKDGIIKKEFIASWQSMIDYALTCDTWNPATSKKWYHIEEMASSLIGLDQVFYNFWTNELIPLVQEMKSYYKLWCDQFLKYSSCAVGFINFLQQPAANSIIIEGLCWVKDGYIKHLDNWNESDIISPLSYLLNTIWMKHIEPTRKSNDSFEAFKFLLSKLVEKQNPVAMEIQSQII